MDKKTKQHKLFDVATTKALDAENGIYEAMISTESVDRDGDVLEATGADIVSYLKNPVVLFGHNYWDANAVVGKAVEVEVIPGSGVRAVFEFAGEDVSADAALVKRLWAGGYLNAISVGFIPLEWEKRKSADGEELERGYTITGWELLEFSIVPVPANQDALRLDLKALQTNSQSMGGSVDVAAENGTTADPSTDTKEPDESIADDDTEQLDEAALAQLVEAIEETTETIMEVYT